MAPAPGRLCVSPDFVRKWRGQLISASTGSLYFQDALLLSQTPKEQVYLAETLELLNLNQTVVLNLLFVPSPYCRPRYDEAYEVS